MHCVAASDRMDADNHDSTAVSSTPGSHVHAAGGQKGAPGAFQTGRKETEAVFKLPKYDFNPVQTETGLLFCRPNSLHKNCNIDRTDSKTFSRR